jgi:hypothetical protein
MRSIARIFVITLMFTGIAVCAPGSDKDKGGNKHDKGKNGKVRQARSENGTYNVNIVGFYRGSGTATVDEASVSLKATVTGSDGTTGNLDAANLTLDGPYFTGTGTINGKNATIRGRLDAAKSSRLVASYHIEGRNNGRIVGTNPADKGDDKWND